MIGMTPVARLQLTISGNADPRTGYLCNISRMDEALRERVVPQLAHAIHTNASCAESTPTRLVVSAWQMVGNEEFESGLPESLSLILTPQLKFTVNKHKLSRESMVNIVQQFEFSASHRLHSKHLSDEQNKEVFGKCNSPNGHGHNYVVEISVDVDHKWSESENVTQQIDDIVMGIVIDRFDHKHLNLDTVEFQDLNPTVENIATVIWKLLEEKVMLKSIANGGEGPPAVVRRLANVKVFETPKTWAEFAGDGA